MKTLLMLLYILTLASCEGIQEYVSIVDDRAPNGTYLPLSEVKSPKTGASAVAKGSFYVFPNGEVGVTAAYGPSGPVAAPKFSIKK